MNNAEERTGCENYLYKDIMCCLNPCNVLDCPEPVCVLDFPGGKKAYLRFKAMLEVLKSGCDIYEAAKTLGISHQVARHIFNKGNIIWNK